MRILLTNDDGIGAPGIEALYDALTAQGEAGSVFDGPLLGAELVWPIAPLTVQSATSHGVTFHEPLMVRDEAVNERMSGVAVDGRPADCVKVAVGAIWPERFGQGERPDLLISGMNAGANVGINVIYSGTVGAALEGAFLGVPSIAVSMHLGSETPDFARGARRARLALERVLEGGLPRAHECLSINVPRTEIGDAFADEMPEVVVRPMNTHGLNDKYERRVSPGGDVYYWAAGGGLDFRTTDDGSDVQALFARKVVVTPLWYDLTAGPESMGRWTARLGDA